MVLTVDIGNTNIVLGVFDQDELVFTARVSTDKNRTSDEYSVMIHGIFEINGFDLSRFDGIILSSVVPQLNSVVAYALGRFTSVRIRHCGPGTPHRLPHPGRRSHRAGIGYGLQCGRRPQ